MMFYEYKLQSVLNISMCMLYITTLFFFFFFVKPNDGLFIRLKHGVVGSKRKYVVFEGHIYWFQWRFTALIQFILNELKIF